MSRAYYSAAIGDFLRDDPDSILGILATNHQFDLEELQRNAWMAQLTILKRQLTILEDGYILLEYSIPRMGKRVDAIVLSHGIVFVIEFKVGEDHYTSYAVDQVFDYSLDLKNFHEQSHDRVIVPVMVATEAESVENKPNRFEDQTFEPLKANKDNLGQVLLGVMTSVSSSDLDPIEWRDSRYKPTPTIIEAAQALYRDHSVSDISRSDAGAINLSLTADAISDIIHTSQVGKQKSICFITGVPGAGKTLAGLNVATQWLKADQTEYAVFLSGNGPLVTVLREALARDEYERLLTKGERNTKKSALSKSAAFIQNIHHFRDAALSDMRPPIERIVIFDEAQRAWTRAQTASFMKQKRHIPEFPMSEPEFLISIMDRHSDWAVIICLVGGGQEINTGEAGLREWFDSIRAHYRQWHVYCSSNLTGDEYMGGFAIQEFVDGDHLKIDSRLHLAVSLRSYRAENVSGLIKAILDNDIAMARELCLTLNRRYSIKITRDLSKAKEWLRAQARGTERYGLMASSGAIRLRPIGINVQADFDVVNWFLGEKEDVRSSYYLEQVATEFDIQGLELDWASVIWDADLRYKVNNWTYQAFRGTKWENVRDATRIQYLKNAYRVLLTRARQGMVIVVPEGNDADKTRMPEYYDGTYNYLKEIGFEII